AGCNPVVAAVLWWDAALSDVAARQAVRTRRSRWPATTRSTVGGVCAPPTDPPRLHVRRADAPVYFLRLHLSVYRHTDRAFGSRYRSPVLRRQFLPGHVLRHLQNCHQFLWLVVSDRLVDGRVPSLCSETTQVQTQSVGRRHCPGHLAVSRDHRLPPSSAAAGGYPGCRGADPLGFLSGCTPARRREYPGIGRSSRSHL